MKGNLVPDGRFWLKASYFSDQKWTHAGGKSNGRS